MNESTIRTPLFDRLKAFLFPMLIVAVVAGIAALLLRQPEPTTITVIPPQPTLVPSPTFTPSATPTPGPYAIYITGAVAQPDQVVTLPYGSRVMHALDAVGGALDTADLERVNLAQRLEDGDQVHVPTRASDTRAMSTSAVRIITPTPGAILVYVVGAVAQPETMISLPIGSRVNDALAAAGGPAGNADLTRVNLSQVLSDGDLIYVPAQGEAAIITPTPNRPAVVHINYADVEELQTLPGIGLALAQAIVDYRTAHGPFGSLQDLDEVPGLGEGKLDGIREMVVFD